MKFSLKVNGEKSIWISVLLEKLNDHAWELAQNESVFTFNNEEYLIKLMNRKGVESTKVKSLDVGHTFFKYND